MNSRVLDIQRVKWIPIVETTYYPTGGAHVYVTRTCVSALLNEHMLNLTCLYANLWFFRSVLRELMMHIQHT